MVTYFDDVVSSYIHVSIPECRLKILEPFSSGSIVKIRCGLLYNPEDLSLQLTTHLLELIYSVKLIVNNQCMQVSIPFPLFNHSLFTQLSSIIVYISSQKRKKRKLGTTSVFSVQYFLKYNFIILFSWCCHCLIWETYNKPLKFFKTDVCMKIRWFIQSSLF